MFLVDANLLLYAKIDDYSQHQAALEWFEQQMTLRVRMGLSWASLLAFVRIATNPRLYDAPLSIEAAWQQVEEWLALSNIWIPSPTDRHSIILGKLLISTQATANLVPDAHLAALAIEHGLEICTTDTDFAKFPDCRWQNPLLHL
ncbi:MAG: type II toxin-antitoxin system VapC family toxin [Acaryochloris sp. RU_4_1]|nr:type II toxin-antitoxin system VapC family toxin [Acaryochloris sp. RU_4_1]NJN38549.1 type II toxin-antitoxin system VapC family toxin [Acaryochloridaceae cyanobacterium CSU_3_4]NJR55275.1 type II toxin-antitoxin system VapC family toxin [Acaryochloris sp. CRU_2_0]